MRKLDTQEILAQKPVYLKHLMHNQLGQLVMFYDSPDDSGEVLAFIGGSFYATGHYDLDDFYEGSEYLPIVGSDGQCVCFAELNIEGT